MGSGLDAESTLQHSFISSLQVLESSAETLWQRTKRKVSENPFVLPAVGLTCFAMYRMVESMFRRDVVAFQKAQRFRIGAQGLAIFVVFSGVWYQQYKHQKTMEIEAAPLEDPLTPTAAGPPPKP